ncbi:hypothetical protein CN481_15680 [Bacillus sp. AFS006103]|nr:hypothetical protein CN481_15680 [Bacillus sp. AFS006103]
MIKVEETTPIYFSDKNLEKAVRARLNVSEDTVILKEDVLQIEILAADNMKIESIEGLQHFTNLKELYLHDNKIIDILPIENLHKLVRLELGNNDLEDINPLRNLVNLTRLAIGFSYKIRTVEPLVNLTQLRHLFLCSNLLTDINKVYKGFICKSAK